MESELYTIYLHSHPMTQGLNFYYFFINMETVYTTKKQS